jgi:tripartite-type tricarboxylate transporter receptor subunit TctC
MPLRPCCLVLMLVLPSAFSVHAQSYPARPIRVIVPFVPGGGVDFMGRLVARKLNESTGQPVIVDNRAGAGGALGSELVAKAAPDGYTLTVNNNSTHGASPALYSKLPYDAIRDFSPISVIATAPHILLVPANLPVPSMKELIELARAKPGVLNYGSSGTGSQSHLSAELFKYVTRTNFTHIPYKGAGASFAALLGGEIQVLFSAATGATPHLKANRLKALAVTGVERSRFMPEIPTFAEQGVARFDKSPWYALMGPAKLPPAIVHRLHAEIVRIVVDPEVAKIIASVGAEPVGGTPTECATAIRNEIELWTQLVKVAGIRVE